MSRSQRLKSILNQANGKEQKYEWLGAAELYGQALGTTLEKDLLRKGELQEQIGYCLYRGAFQAETQEEFKRCMLEAAVAYDRAAGANADVDQAKSVHCHAMALYARSWTLVDAAQKKKILDDCSGQLKEAMRFSEEADDSLNYGKSVNVLLFCFWDRETVEWDWAENNKHLEEAATHSQSAISTLSEAGDDRELARAYVVAGLLSMRSGLSRAEKRAEFIQTAFSHAQKALELSKKTGDADLIMWANWLAAATQFQFTGDLELSMSYAEDALQSAKKTGDNFDLGMTFCGMSLVAEWVAIAEEDPDKKREGHERAMRCAEDATRHLLTVFRYDFLAQGYSNYVESCFFLADEETDFNERRSFLEKAIEVGQKGLDYAEQSAVPGIYALHHSLSKTLYSLSRMETQVDERRRLLEEAAEHREHSIDIWKRAYSPFDYWDHGVMQNYAALVRAELATIETDEKKKRKLLEEAVSHMETCIEFCGRWITIVPKTSLFAVFGWYHDWFGGILSQLYSLTRKTETLEKAIKVYQDTAETYRKAELPSRVAEANWHTAKLYDHLGEHTKAERHFQSASENYKLVAEKIPQLKEFYIDYALFMRAWSEIEKAIHNHTERALQESRRSP